MKFLLAFALLLPLQTTLSGQNGLCDWKFQVSAVPLPSGDGINPAMLCSDGNACDYLHYYVYIAHVSSENDYNQEFTLSFTQLFVTGKLDLTPAFAATNKTISEFDDSRSLSCTVNSVGLPPDAMLSAVGDIFTYYQQGMNGETQTMSVRGRKLLCIIAVRPFPGEQINLSNLTGSIAGAGTGCITASVDTHPNINIGPMGGLPVSLAKSVTIPPACTNNTFRLKFGPVEDYPAPGFPNRKRVAVYIASGNAAPTAYTIDRLDFLLKITTTQLASNLIVEPGLIPLSQIDAYKEPPLNQSNDRRVYAETALLTFTTSSANAPTAQNTLFHLVLDGPQLASDCAETTLRFTDYARMSYNGTCCKPSIPVPTATAAWSSYPNDCPVHCSSVTVKVLPIFGGPQFPAEKCKHLQFDVVLSTTGTPLTYEGVEIVLDVHHTGNLEVEPFVSSSNYCVPVSNCVSGEHISGSLLRVTISMAGISLPLATGSPAGLIRLGFAGEAACVQYVSFHDARLLPENSGGVYCLPSVQSDITENSASDDICLYGLTLAFNGWNGAIVDEVYYMDTYGPGNTLCTDGITAQGPAGGSQFICACEDPDPITQTTAHTVTPSKDDNYLNGVTTYDLVLISKHILGLEPFSGPNEGYMRIAADANNSAPANQGNGITTFDIIEIRKLILGITNTFTNNDSYRFVSESDLPLPSGGGNVAFVPLFNPYDAFTIPPFDGNGRFVAVKTGDVNGSFAGTSFTAPPEDRTAAARQFAFALPGADAGLLRVPVFPGDDFDAVCWQAAFRYDTAALRLKGAEWAGPGADTWAWYEPERGTVRAAWFDPEGTAQHREAGVPMFHLLFERLKPSQPAEETVLSLDERALPCLWYDAAGSAGSLRLRKADISELKVSAPVVAVPAQPAISLYPNPAAGHFRISVRCPEPVSATLTLSDASGRALFSRSLDWPAGETTLPSTSLPALQPGTYAVELRGSFGVATQTLLIALKN